MYISSLILYIKILKYKIQLKLVLSTGIHLSVFSSEQNMAYIITSIIFVMQ